MSYKVIIVSSVLMIFVLGLVFFSLRNQKVTTSFQIYGAPVVATGVPAVFQVVQFDNESRKNLPVRVTQVVYNVNGQTVTSPAASQVPRLPDSFTLQFSQADVGQNSVDVHLEGWNKESRVVTLPIAVVGANTYRIADLAAPLRAFNAPATDAPVAMDMAFQGGGLVAEVENTVWLRLLKTEPEPAPMSAAIKYGFADRQHQTTRTAPGSGLAPLKLTPQGISQNFTLEVEPGDKGILWQEMFSPATLASISYPTTPHPDGAGMNNQRDFVVRSSTVSMELYCTHWINATPVQTVKVQTNDNLSAPTPLQVNAPGLSWLTCSDTFLGAEGFVAYAPRFSGTAPEGVVASLAPLFPDDPVIQRWASSPPGHDLPREAQDYLLARLEPRGLNYEQLYNTYQDDVANLANDAGNQRDLVLVLIAIVGFGLLFWTVAVAVNQHRTLNRSFRKFLDEEEEPQDELTQEGLARKRSYLPAIMILVTAAANLIALIWLLRLVFF